jgi:hypothetical protein
MSTNESLTARVVHLFLTTSRAGEGRHVLGHSLLLHHRKVGLGARSVHCIRTGEVLPLDVVDAVCHYHRWLGVSQFIHFSVSKKLSRFILEFIHGRSVGVSIAPGVSHRHVTTVSCVQTSLPRLIEFLEVNVLQPFGTSVVAFLGASSHTSLQVTAAVAVRRETTTSALTRSTTHKLLQLLFFEIR